MSSNIKKTPKDEIVYLIFIRELAFDRAFAVPSEKVSDFLSVLEKISFVKFPWSDAAIQKSTDIFTLSDSDMEIRVVSKKAFQAQKFYLDSLSDEDSDENF